MPSALRAQLAMAETERGHKNKLQSQSSGTIVDLFFQFEKTRDILLKEDCRGGKIADFENHTYSRYHLGFA